MSQASRREEILKIIEQNPGATGVTVYKALLRRSRLAQWFGENSFIAQIFSPTSFGSIYVHLYELENAGLIRSLWGLKVGDKPRRRHYFTTGE